MISKVDVVHLEIVAVIAIVIVIVLIEIEAVSLLTIDALPEVVLLDVILW